MQNLPRFLSDFRLTAHVWTKYFRNADRTVCLKIVLEKCDQHSRRSYYCVVQCVCEIFVSVTSFYTDAKTSCLCITKVRTASYFKVFLLSWRPCLYVTRFYFKVGKVTLTGFQSTNRDIKRTEQINSVFP